MLNQDILYSILSYCDKDEYIFNIVSKDWSNQYKDIFGLKTSTKNCISMERLYECIISCKINPDWFIFNDNYLDNGTLKEEESSIVRYVLNPLYNVPVYLLIDVIDILDKNDNITLMERLIKNSIINKSITNEDIKYMLNIYLKNNQLNKDLILALSHRADCILFDYIISNYSDYELINIDDVKYGSSWYTGSQYIVDLCIRNGTKNEDIFCE